MIDGKDFDLEAPAEEKHEEVSELTEAGESSSRRRGIFRGRNPRRTRTVRTESGEQLWERKYHLDSV